MRRNDCAVYRVGGSVVELSSATRETGVRFPANAEYFTSRMVFNGLVKNCYHHPHEQKLESLQHISKEERDHQFMLPKVYTERFKQSFLNKCLFNDFKNFVIQFILTVTLTHL